MPRTKLSQKYQIVIPRLVRNRMKLKAGMIVTVHPLNDTHAIISKEPLNYADALRGLGKEVWENIDTDAYLKQLREEWRT